MIVFLGVIFWFLINMWLTVAVFFITVSTFSQGLLAGVWWEKIIGVVLWFLILYSWYSLSAGLTWKYTL
jgi:hypothetical protein